MTVANVKSQWVGGDLYFYDKSGNEIAHFDGTNRKLVIPSGSALTAAGVELASVTASAAEINVLDGVVAGTVSASKALVVGANKNLDTLAIADGGLKLGAGAGTAVTSTADELNLLDGAAAPNADGLGFLRVARATFDPSTNADERTIAAHSLGVTIPDDAIVVGGFIEVNTTFTSATDAATVAIHVEGADDIVAAIAISDVSNPWDAGMQAIIPKANTPESTGVKLSAAREITATVAVEALTAGKATIFLYYVVGA